MYGFLWKDNAPLRDFRRVRMKIMKKQIISFLKVRNYAVNKGGKRVLGRRPNFTLQIKVSTYQRMDE